MKLLNIVEPLFQYLAFLERAGINGVSVEYSKARSRIENLFSDMLIQSGKNRTLSMQFQKIRLPLVFFTDSIISNSKVSFAGKWNSNRIAYSYGEMTGDYKFFSLLEDTLKRNLFYEKECLKVFYMCLGLGFTGVYSKKPDIIQKHMWNIADRLDKEVFKSDSDIVIDHVNRKDLKMIKIPFYIKIWNLRFVFFMISFVLILWIFFNAFFYCHTVSKSNEKLNKLYSSSNVTIKSSNLRNN